LKIVDVTEFYSERGGGVRSHLTTRGHFLCQLGNDHIVIAPGPKDVETVLYASTAPQGQSRLIRMAGLALPYDRTYHLLARFDKIRERVRAERPDVLEAHSPYLGAAAVVAAGRSSSQVRTAFWHADHVGTYLEPWMGALSRPVFQAVRVLLAPFDATFVAGAAQARKLRAVGIRNVEHVPFGVDVQTFHPGARSETVRRSLLGEGHAGATLLVGVGRFAFEKRWDVVLDAFERVRARREAVLVLFGDGPGRAKLERLAPPGVRFLGFETDRAKLAASLASADVLVHGCPRETFGLVVSEAVACGLPVVVPNAGGAAESADRSCGEVYPSLDAEACAAAILRLLARDPVELRALALEAATRVPTATEHFARVLAVYDDLLRSC
jgi:alpha-1,6-mannosyltransferase